MKTILLTLLLLTSSTASNPTLLGPPNLPTFTWIPATNDLTIQQEHHQFGYDIGKKFKSNIQHRITSNAYLQDMVTYFHTNPSTYTTYLNNNNNTYPNYIIELQGISDGSNVPFSVLFVSQLLEEFSFFYTATPTTSHNPQRCSDITWINPNGEAYLVHNEDSGGGDVNHTVLITAPKGVGGSVPFTTYTYLGNTPTGAYGWNKHGILFTMNYVAPTNANINGLGRVFVARDLLTANSLQSAVEIVNVSMAAGHNYQLLDINTNEIWNVEIASFDRSKVSILNAGDPAQFHANTYQHLGNISQQHSNSSTHRDARAKIMLRNDPIENGFKDMYQIIGDQTDTGWPIYHDNLSHEKGEKSDWTLCTLSVHPKENQLHIFTTNPKFNSPTLTIDLQTWFDDVVDVVDVVDVANQTYRPVVIMHGMNNNEHGYSNVIDSLKKQYPGIYVTALAVYDDLSSILTPMDKQLQSVTAAIQSNPKLKNGFNFYGESQGALLARAYVTTSNNPPVHNLVAICGPQAGVGECPTIDGKHRSNRSFFFFNFQQIINF